MKRNRETCKKYKERKCSLAKRDQKKCVHALDAAGQQKHTYQIKLFLLFRPFFLFADAYRRDSGRHSFSQCVASAKLDGDSRSTCIKSIDRPRRKKEIQLKPGPPKKEKEIKKTKKKKETANGKKTIKHGWIDFWNI